MWWARDRKPMGYSTHITHHHRHSSHTGRQHHSAGELPHFTPPPRPPLIHNLYLLLIFPSFTNLCFKLVKLMAPRLLYYSAIFPFLLTANWLLLCSDASSANGTSAVGDPGMRRDGLRVAFEGWNFCNEVGAEAPHMGSPRAADCFDLLSKPNTHTHTNKLHLHYHHIFSLSLPLISLSNL